MKNIEKTLQTRIFKCLQQYREKTALECGEEQISYEELDRNSNCIANMMMSSNDVEKLSNICILLDRRTTLITAMIGIFKAGSVFVPLDPAYPDKKIKKMVETVEPTMIITDPDNVHRLKNYNLCENTQVVVISDQFYKDNESMSLYKPNVFYSVDDPIYIYFTSGSTGVPKAIVGKNNSLLHFIEWELETFGVDETFHVSQFTTPSHDPLLRDVFVALFSGGKVCIPKTKEIILDSEQIINWIDQYGINLIHCTPSLFRIINSTNLNEKHFSHLKYILLAGERVIPWELKNWFDCFNDKIQLVNLYGSTETTMIKTFYLIKPEDVNRRTIPVGVPMKRAKVIILDNNMQVCPSGALGEIIIRTPYRSLGYYNNPELNNSKFIQNPFNDNPNDFIYKTGDLGRILPDGNLEFCGRIDRQVKIRGIRVELEEIENEILKYPPIKECVVHTISGSVDEILAAYYISNQEIDEIELRNFLEDSIHNYMMPAHFIKLETMPLTPNGKLNYDELPHPDTITNQICTAPRNDIEKKLAEIWCEILGVSEVGIKQSFLHIGGHSLNIMSLISKINKQFDVELPLSEVFKDATIEGIADYIRKSNKTEYVPITPVTRRRYYPVSSSQKRMLALSQFAPQSTAYNMPCAMWIEGNLDRDRFENAFSVIFARHEVLRTSFELVDSEYVQQVHEKGTFKMDYFDASLEQAEGIISSFIQPFDLEKVPLFRVALIRVSELKHLFIFDMHHVVADAESMSIIIRELVQLYEGKSLEDLTIQYKDYCVWQSKFKETNEYKSQESYWLDLTKGEIPTLQLPLDFVRPEIKSFEGDIVKYNLASDLTTDIRKLALNCNSTVHMVLMTAYYVLLHKYTGQEDIIVGTVSGTRRHEEMKDNIGLFINTLPMRNYPYKEKSFDQLLNEVKSNAINAYENQDYPFEELIEKLEIERDTSRNPLFDVAFDLQNEDNHQIEILNLKFKPHSYEEKVSKFDLCIHSLEINGELQFDIEYCTKLFKRETIERLLQHYLNIIKEVLNTPTKKIAEIQMLSQDENKQLLIDFNPVTNLAKNITIHEQFEQIAEESPKAVAIEYRDGESLVQIHYDELNCRANRLACFLKEKGIGPGKVVGIMTKKSTEMIISILGILKAGGAYLPIDPMYYPENRILSIINDSQISLLLAEDTFEHSLFTKANYQYQFEILFYDEIVNKSQNNSSHNLKNMNQSDDLAYVIYTSGTTGQPKGVLIKHSGVVNLSSSVSKSLGISINSKVLQFASCSFDASVWEIFTTLLNGATLYLPQRNHEFTNNLSDILRENAINVVTLPPSVLKSIRSANLPNLSVIVSAGESCTKDIINKWSIGRRFFNAYGPSETTVCATLTDCLTPKSTITIGKPINNTNIYIVNSAMQPVPVGIQGELCIGGVGIAAGYLNKQDLTLEKFIPNPFIPGEKMYRTGDLARWMPDGSIEFIGRADQQIKLRGFRIETEEIEYQLTRHEAVKEAVVIDIENENGEKSLSAFVVSNGKFDELNLKTHLMTELANYMIPSFFIQIDKIPLTKNGKIDRKVLKELAPNMNMKTNNELPRNEIEQELIEIWKDVLNLNIIGISDNFFNIGGHSLNAIEMVSKAKKLGLTLRVNDLFQYPTIKKLVDHQLIQKAALVKGESR
ncbi:amino acid adenylation domain-containing protein [Viridibacillus sp. YIM B01967]|uniref:Amino acid adenylation domain-containing protein n=1 Tax=Viridibacillus soli TaxID=2798301 RepID=A0ABS1H3R3_9BACL|nr:non-ribosomal peptide synthetase [Viridibacillus soli]MBK3493949.1 amino acid adenylation domain-containing protein [Viridibacillus soli]